MAANKFATMLHRNTNKITLVLVYAILEWILILPLLLLNSLFSYLIIKFADYFGLKRPCIWCTRIDHIIEPGKINNNSCIDLVCEAMLLRFPCWVSALIITNWLNQETCVRIAHPHHSQIM